jgi:imidazoleglycerol-phosphate dehydratase/histidinol-phosphatase
MGEQILFIDRDGTLIEEPEDCQVDALEKVRLVRGVIPALLELAKCGYRFVIVSNQDGLGTDSFPESNYRICHEHMLALFGSQGVTFDQTFVCPHLPDDGCECRKPRAGLLTRFLAESDIDLERSAVIGDRATDIELADRIGVRGYLLGGNDGLRWADIVTALCHSDRQAGFERITSETRISAMVNLDTPDPIRVSTGIGFYDHMLEQVSKHGGFSLVLECDGDLEIDDHHTVEDTAICLGTAVRKALGNKAGIGRYGFVLPMDESEASASIDLSGRGRIVFNAQFGREKVGELSTEMVEHFFRSFADSLGAAVHVSVTGANAHHMVEACFKAVGRALRMAIRREGTDLPSTKGMLA